MTFSRWSNPVFGFNAYTDIDEMEDRIDSTIYKGGYRSQIGHALSDANTWVFQPSQGMRSFPGRDDDNNEHEILIATDGCLTSLGYYFTKGLNTIRRRGIKLTVLGLRSPESYDPRCQETLDAMAETSQDIYMINSWEELDQFSSDLNNGACIQR